MPSVFTYEFDASTYKGKTQFNTGLFINGQFIDGSDNTYIECVPSQFQVATYKSYPPAVALSTLASVQSFSSVDKDLTVLYS